jgi:putative nucleotidyltransferase with HDIG domain
MPYYVSIEQLQVGLYVQLDLHWMDHPFGFNSFKIKSEDQIQTLRQLGLKKIRYDPDRSDSKPRPAPVMPMEVVVAEEPVAAPPPLLEPDNPLILAKKARIERLRQYRQAVAQTEKALLAAARTVRSINTDLLTQPKKALAEAENFIGQVADTFLADPDVTIHAMGGKGGGEEVYHHGLNVTVLVMMMAKDLGLSAEEGRVLGLGSLFHDIGLREVPSIILRKTEPLTMAEQKVWQLHCEYGVKLGRQVGLPPEVLAIIFQHHEMMDGSGYPKKLKGADITFMARLVEVANRYDTLCNPLEFAQALSPHEALSWMFAHERAKHDPKLMEVLIRCLGVYPPGTVVHLSNGATAMVTSVNPRRPLKPMLMVYDPEVPRNEAIILDMAEEADVNISQAIKPRQLPRAAMDYLCMRKHVSYYFVDGGVAPE